MRFITITKDFISLKYICFEYLECNNLTEYFLMFHLQLQKLCIFKKNLNLTEDNYITML